MDRGKDLFGIHTEKPKDWKPVPTPNWDLSKVARHQLDDGLVFYRDVRNDNVTSNNADTYLKRYRYGSHTDYRHDFLELCLYGEKIYVLPSKQDGKGFNSTGDKTTDGKTIWTIGEIRGRVEFRDVYTYPWVAYGEVAPWIALEGIENFTSFEQQCKFLKVLKQFLAVLGGGNRSALLDGEIHEAVVRYDPELQVKLDSGGLLL